MEPDFSKIPWCTIFVLLFQTNTAIFLLSVKPCLPLGLRSNTGRVLHSKPIGSQWLSTKEVPCSRNLRTQVMESRDPQVPVQNLLTLCLICASGTLLLAGSQPPGGVWPGPLHVKQAGWRNGAQNSNIPNSLALRAAGSTFWGWPPYLWFQALCLYFSIFNLLPELLGNCFFGLHNLK